MFRTDVQLLLKKTMLLVDPPQLTMSTLFSKMPELGVMKFVAQSL